MQLRHGKKTGKTEFDDRVCVFLSKFDENHDETDKFRIATEMFDYINADFPIAIHNDELVLTIYKKCVELTASIIQKTYEMDNLSKTNVIRALCAIHKTHIKMGGLIHQIKKKAKSNNGWKNARMFSARMFSRVSYTDVSCICMT